LGIEQKLRVLLTGATGFIGSHVARLLVNANCEVHALVRENSNLWRIKDIASQLNLVQADLLAADKVQVQLDKIRPEMCLHLAWYAVPTKYLTAHENIDLLRGSLQLISYLAQLGCKRFVGLGTCFEYDIGAECLTETSPVKPRNLYAASKLALQTVLGQLASTTGMEAVWLRLFYLYGPYEPEQRLVPAVVCSLLRNQVAKVTKGEQVRDFLHVEDVAAAIWAVAQSNLTGPVNIGSGKAVTVRDIATRIGDILNHPELIEFGALPHNPTDPMFVCADNHKLAENTAWTPQYDLESGLRQTTKWWQKHLSVGRQ